MQALDPLWTEPVKLTFRTTDPLGLARISDWATEDLVPGITTVTTVARNYSFYCWIIGDLIRNACTADRATFAREFVKRESALVLSSLLHRQGHLRDATPLGTERGRRFLGAVQKGRVRVDFSPSESNLEGFYGLYYRNAMRTLGLTIRGRSAEQLTELGNSLYSAFEAVVKGTQYYAHRSSNLQRIVDLENLAERCCICRLRSSTDERALLTAAMFAKNLPQLRLKESRRTSLLMVLSMIEICGKNGANLDDESFRGLIFYSQFASKGSVRNYDHGLFRDTWSRWRLYQLHEFFGFAAESLLAIFVRCLKQKEMTLDEFLARHNSVEKLHRELETHSRCTTWHELLENVLQNFGFSSISKENSRRFALACNLKAPLNEMVLRNRLLSSAEKNQFSDVVAQGLAIIALCCLHAFAEIDNMSDAAIWFKSRALQEFGVFSFVATTRHHWNTGLENFVREIFLGIINQHDLIALDKRLSGHDTFRFEHRGKAFAFKRDVEAGFRNSRHYSMASILSDLGLVKEHNGVLLLTSLGRRMLGC
jgi:hypothetical protein